ncbi:putative MFS family arabinose efflux permease [Paenibacillus taihuensis]|uniref:Putative MFS family arabinose efflux permease n=1 Tax=Paenibacillus taihuensis TaxID=1156355 RepID=A0A3D9Q0X4_9BACL|nr:MFS transporter [Paenibacillus taihuensis]REE56301.1 putative MFS family arabinose efflux permease [Paenibacillus taihuensis]
MRQEPQQEPNQQIQQEQERPAALWTRPFIALTASFFLLFLGLQMLLSSFPAYVKGEFHAGNVQVSLVTSVFALAAIASRFATAALMKRVSRMALLITGLLIAAAATGLYTAAGSFGTLLLLRIAYGIGFGIASTILPTLVSRIIPVRRMGEGIGYFGLSTSLAMSIGPSIGLNVMKHGGFTELTMLGFIASVLIFPVLWQSRSKQSDAAITAAPARVPAQAAAKSQQPSQPAPKAGFNAKLLFPVLLNTMLSITYSGLLSFLALFGDYVHIEQVGLFFLFNAITIILIRPFSGRIFDRKGHMAVLIPAGLCVTASMVLLSGTHAMPMLIVSALLYGLGFGAIQPTIQAWMLRSSAPEQYGTVNSMFYNSTDFGVAIGALLLGAISAASNYSVMYRYSAGCMALFVIFIVLQAAMTTSRRRLKQAAMES